MKLRHILIILSILLVYGCGDTYIKKPEKLVSEKEMVEILVDLHLAKALYEQKENRLKLGDVKIKSEDFYYSVLNKYDVADTVFEKSIVFYASFPKDFEKIYAEVLDKVSQMKDEYSEEKEEPVDGEKLDIR